MTSTDLARFGETWETWKAEVSVYYCFARSGGTLINRCLGCISGNLVLSEINPMSSIATVESQATGLDWTVACCKSMRNSQHKTYGEKVSFLAHAAMASQRSI